MIEAFQPTNGQIQIHDGSGKFFPATVPLLRELYGRKVGEGNFNIVEGEGAHPLVKVTFPAMVFDEVSISMLGIEDCGALLKKMADGNTDISGMVREHNSGRISFLYPVLTGNANLFGSCIAANDEGPVAIAWDAAKADALGKWKVMRASIEGGGSEGFLAILPKDVPLPALPSKQWLVTLKKDKPRFAEITVTGELEPIGLAPIVRTTLLLAATQPTTSREEALIKSGIETEEFKGERPTGVKFPPKGDQASPSA